MKNLPTFTRIAIIERPTSWWTLRHPISRQQLVLGLRHLLIVEVRISLIVDGVVSVDLISMSLLSHSTTKQTCIMFFSFTMFCAWYYCSLSTAGGLVNGRLSGHVGNKMVIEGRLPLSRLRLSKYLRLNRAIEWAADAPQGSFYIVTWLLGYLWLDPVHNGDTEMQTVLSKKLVLSDE